MRRGNGMGSRLRLCITACERPYWAGEGWGWVKDTEGELGVRDDRFFTPLRYVQNDMWVEGKGGERMGRC